MQVSCSPAATSRKGRHHLKTGVSLRSVPSVLASSREMPCFYLHWANELRVALEEWLMDLIPPLRLEAWRGVEMPPHILNMHAVFHYLRILLHRPACFNFKAEAEARSISLGACETAAQVITLRVRCMC
jgi:hypothetical protein